ncbi:hypothetical protein T261_4570 [Streptomyces lydicus]|nr:hypothetical protein T261_4570 [Streptomyces lydicus]
MTGAAGRGALDVDPEMLKKFKQRVDELLYRLKASQADPGALRHQKIDPSHFGQGFAEAKNLATAYEKVLSQLETFSRAFGDQIESLGLSTHFIGQNFEAVDTDVKNRLTLIQRRTQELYNAPQPQHRSAGSTEPDLGNSKSAGDDAI